MALWNAKDPILKERMFGLTNQQGNHGEDVKEYYFFLDSTPTHSYMKMLYKYPQVAYPYAELVQVNGQRTQAEPEFELFDALPDIFLANRYFDVFIEYAKAGAEDILCRITAINRGPDPAPIMSCRICGIGTSGRGRRVALNDQSRRPGAAYTGMRHLGHAGGMRARQTSNRSICCSPKTRPMSSGCITCPIHRRM